MRLSTSGEIMRNSEKAAIKLTKEYSRAVLLILRRSEGNLSCYLLTL
ncbi:MAG: hypothetical protein Q8930_10640 [Bacillota bacterium]|nr:hypothetical protein [Bacillota bacterium]